MYDLIVCIRCHKYAGLVLDTFNSVRFNTNPKQTLVVCAVDGRPDFAANLKNLVGEEHVYCSKKRYGWGPGLYSLLVESIEWAESKWEFNHFMSIDYDTLFIGKQADTSMLQYIVSLEVGLIGKYNAVNSHWSVVYGNEKARLEEIFGSIPDEYRPGEGVQGGCLLLTRNLINTMKMKGMFAPPFSNASKHTRIADDHLLPLFTRMCGLRVVSSRRTAMCQWTASRNPCGLEKEEVKIFHPTKLRPNAEKTPAEIEIRNYFRKLRGEKPLVSAN